MPTPADSAKTALAVSAHQDGLSAETGERPSGLFADAAGSQSPRAVLPC